MSTLHRTVRLTALAAVVSLAACRHRATSGSDHPTSADPFATMDYAQGPLPPDAKIFLVAGGDDVANFAAEVVEQRALWVKAGLEPSEIACYYAKPSRQALRVDGEQLSEVAPLLRDCYEASPATLHAHLRLAAGRSPAFMYLYVSSHGLPPLLRWKAGVREPAELGAHLELRRGEVGTFDRHAIGLEAGDGPGLGQVEDMLEAHRQGATPEDIVFTPDTLAGVLETLPEATPAIVVLQACFSGGFIGRPDDDGPSPLTRRPHTTILTATSSRRPSFGCSPGSHRTYYGGAFNRVLAQKLEEAPRLPPELPWDDIHQRVRFVVETMEFIDGETPSEPSFFSSDAPSSTNTAASASPSKPAADSTPSTH